MSAGEPSGSCSSPCPAGEEIWADRRRALGSPSSYGLMITPRPGSPASDYAACLPAAVCSRVSVSKVVSSGSRARDAVWGSRRGASGNDNGRMRPRGDARPVNASPDRMSPSGDQNRAALNGGSSRVGAGHRVDDGRGRGHASGPGTLGPPAASDRPSEEALREGLPYPLRPWRITRRPGQMPSPGPPPGHPRPSMGRACAAGRRCPAPRRSPGPSRRGYCSARV